MTMIIVDQPVGVNTDHFAEPWLRGIHSVDSSYLDHMEYPVVPK